MKLKFKDIEETCRVCLCGKSELISLNEVGPIKTMCEQIEHCSRLKIIRSGHPPSICQECAEELTICHKFLKKCCESDEKLVGILKFKNAEDIESKDSIESESKNNEGTICGNISIEEPVLKEYDISISENLSAENSDEDRLGDKNRDTSRRHKSDKVREHTCEVCGKSFSSASNLRVHQRLHSGELPFRCAQCGRGFAQQGSLAAHTRRHSGERPFRCLAAACAAAFAESSHLRRHASVHSQERPFVCAACGKAVKSAFALQQHAKLHVADREHVCHSCGAAFSLRGNLAAHVRARHSQRSGQCPVCCRCVADLHEHMPMHTGEKPHVCAACGKRFSRRRGLLVHSRQHSAAARLRCSVEGCERSFAARWLLDCHLLKHEGSTPFTCSHCSKGFVRACHLTRHLKFTHRQEGEGEIDVTL